MPLIFVGRTVESYIEAYKNGQIEYPRRCPGCGAGRLHKHGCYVRKAVTHGTPTYVPIQRFQCPQCRKTCSFLPSVFIPRRSLTTPEREFVALGLALGSRCAA